MICRVVLLLLFLTGTRALLVKSIPIGETEELKNTASKAAGVFRSRIARSTRPELKNVIVVTAANAAYSHHVQNFCCWMNRLGFHALLFSLDSEMHAYALDMASKDKDSSKEGLLIHSYMWGTNIKKVAEWRTPAFHAITTAKLEVVLSLLRLHYDVLFVDTDVALLRDPFPYLMWKNVDMAYSVNKICPHSDTFDVFKELRGDEGNTGFYYIRSTNSTIRLYDLTISEAKRFPNLDEQTIFWTFVKDESRMRGKGAPDVVDLGYCHDFEYSGLVRSRRRKGEEDISIPYVDVRAPHFKTATSAGLLKNGLFSQYANKDHEKEIVICPLDGCLFSAGALRGVSYHMLEDGLKWRRETSIAIHANFMKGSAQKSGALKRHGLWLHMQGTQGINGTSTCLPYNKKSYRAVQKQ